MDNLHFLFEYWGQKYEQLYRSQGVNRYIYIKQAVTKI